MNKLWHIQTMEYYSALKKKEPSSHAKIWRKLECVLLSGRSQIEKAAHCVIPTLCRCGKGTTTETRGSVGAKGEAGGER